MQERNIKTDFVLDDHSYSEEYVTGQGWSQTEEQQDRFREIKS